MATVSPPLQAELEYFAANLAELLDKAEGRFALIKGTELIGIFNTEAEAVRAGYRSFGNEAFLVKHIVEAEVPLSYTSFNLGV